jgi:hypothetical protein
MIRQSYADFVSLFGNLNPYELDHVSDALQVKFEEILSNRARPLETLQFSLQDIKHVLTRAMRDVQVELAESKMEEAQQQIARAKAVTFTPKKVTNVDVYKLNSNRKSGNANAG